MSAPPNAKPKDEGDAPLAGDRRAAFRRLISALGTSVVGRERGLGRLQSFSDLRASLPVLDARAHLQQIEAGLGFEAGDDPPGAAAERESVVARWTESGIFDRDGPGGVCVLGKAQSALAERGHLDDLRAWVSSPELVRSLPRSGAEELVRQLRDRGPSLLVVQSMHTLAWLERHLRRPIERAVPSLRALMAHYDLEQTLRSRLPVLHAGRWHAAGRVALPARRTRPVLQPHRRAQLCLVWGSTLLELRELGRAGTVEGPQDMRCVDLHEAVLGARYELVVSSAAGFLRARTGRYVRVLGYESLREPRPEGRLGAKSETGRMAEARVHVPRVQPIEAPPAALRLEGVTLRGAWLTSALRQAFAPEDPALVAAKIRGRGGATVEEAKPGERARFPSSLGVRIEARGVAREGFESRLAERFDAQLARLSPAYAFLRERSELEAPTVQRALDGQAREDMWNRASALQGAVARPQIRVLES